MNLQNDQPLRPTQFAENKIIRLILDNTFPPKSNLPAERELARQIGVTRPTLRETLQRLAREGWIRIRHGKATTVNNYWTDGGLGLLGTLAQYADELPRRFIQNLLEVRLNILPPCSRAAAVLARDLLQNQLGRAPAISDPAETFALFDWQLQELMVRHSGNCIYPLILNDFKQVYQRLAAEYFQHPRSKKSSVRYYQRLAQALIQGPEAVERVVTEVMEESLGIWMSPGFFDIGV